MSSYSFVDLDLCLGLLRCCEVSFFSSSSDVEQRSTGFLPKQRGIWSYSWFPLSWLEPQSQSKRSRPIAWYCSNHASFSQAVLFWCFIQCFCALCCHQTVTPFATWFKSSSHFVSQSWRMHKCVLFWSLLLKCQIMLYKCLDFPDKETPLCSYFLNLLYLYEMQGGWTVLTRSSCSSFNAAIGQFWRDVQFLLTSLWFSIALDYDAVSQYIYRVLGISFGPISWLIPFQRSDPAHAL